MQRDRLHAIRRAARGRDCTQTRHHDSHGCRDGRWQRDTRRLWSVRVQRRGMPWRASRRGMTPNTREGAVGPVRRGRRCRGSMRGAAMLDAVFTLAALMAGAQGLAQWQAASGATPAAVAASSGMVAMAFPSHEAGETSREGRAR